MGAVAGVPALRYIGYPWVEKTVSGGEDPIRVASPDDVKPGQPLRVTVVGNRRDGWLRMDDVKLGACWLVRGDDGHVRAFSTCCPHLGCGIDWNEQTRQFDCPCHGSVFDTGGRCVAGPSPRGMDELDVQVGGNDVKVTYRRFRVSTSKKEPLA